jgi:gluconolactonase
MRLGEFEIPPQSGDSEGATLAVFHFGSGGAGSARANQQRWLGQFAPEGRKVLLAEGEAGGKRFTIVDLAGTFNKPDGPPIQRRSKPVPGSRVINAMLEADDGAYFFKLTGLEKTVGASKADFLESFGGRISDTATGEEADK